MARSSEFADSAVGALYDRAAHLPLEQLGFNLHVGYWEDSQDETPYREAAERLTDLVTKRLRVGPGRRSLDVGCGAGGPALRVARATGSAVVGVNISREQLAFACALAEREEMTDLLSFRHADGTDLPFDADSFDAVWAVESMPHMDRVRVLREMSRVVRPGGRVVITDMFARKPVAEDRQEVLERFREAWMVGPLAPIGDYPALLRDAGLRLLELADLTEHVLGRSLPSLAGPVDGAQHASAGPAGAEIGDQAALAYLADLAEGGELGYLLLVAELLPELTPVP
ncbi:methyltransferase domain-containing protein [Streptomyces sp. MP131-18]|uniref:SAM-dependent methyltransferase n=1 Tax=Streptomyces sp. MP131-18 TaxID=1857892 RepID=UPI00097C3E86|nr:methyltransferase domain-containing protein [Streptomyces sp. MP131-18]ONK16238.1 Demethylrebeccamycin-D-glucose O-methyltransferase [Streptomyces sp. MP131-18]